MADKTGSNKNRRMILSDIGVEILFLVTKIKKIMSHNFTNKQIAKSRDFSANLILTVNRPAL